jgi:predicted CXXCH cytochrome family protein
VTNTVRKGGGELLIRGKVSVKKYVAEKLLFILPGSILVVVLGLILISSAVSSPTNEVKLTANAGIGKIQLSWRTDISGVNEIRIYRSNTPEVTPTQGNYLISVEGLNGYNDAAVLAGQTYYYLVAAVLIDGREYLSNQASGIAFPINPHGNYTDNTVACALCHQAHGGLAPRLLADVSVRAICYLCHGNNGVSSYNIQGEYSRIASGHWLQPDRAPMMKCTDCHNTHDGGKDGGGNQIKITKLLEARVNGQRVHTGGGEGFCYSCHQGKSNFYPIKGRGHNFDSLAMQGEANISCLACHESHAANLPYLLRTLPKSGAMEVTGVNASACLTCHQVPLSNTRDNAWNGAAAYNGSGGKDNCFVCHDPHGTAMDSAVPPGMNSKYLNYSYDVAYSPARTAVFNEADYNTCFRSGCHSASDLLGTNTNFKDAPSAVNLHEKHLTALVTTDQGNAVCKECHRPHGAVESENPLLRARVGFPAQSVTGLEKEGVTIGPLFSSDLPGEGSCSLSCHGANHVAGEPGPLEINSVYSQSIP